MVILFDQFNMPRDIYGLVFSTEQQEIVAKLLINYIKTNGREITRTQMSMFATKLHEGKIVTTIDKPEYKGKKVKLSYNKRQFYDRIVTPMKSMGILNYDLYKKTYSLSDKFNKLMIRVGLDWLRELKKPPLRIKEK